MASIYKRPGSSVYQCQFYVSTDGGGLRKERKSTGKTNKKEAMAAAVEMERSAQAAIETGSNKAQQAKGILAEAVAEVERGTFNAQAARKYVARLLAVATGEEMLDFSVEGWLTEWLRRKARDSSKATVARYKKSIETFTGWLGADRSARPLESVTVADARSWRDGLQDQGRAGKTVNKYTKDVGAAFRAAIREGLISFNPFAALESLATDDSLDRKPFTLAEVGQLLAAAPSNQWRGLILVACFTGLRLGDAARLSWKSIDLIGKTITLIPSKTKRKKREVRIPIQSELLAYLEALPIHDDTPDAPVFPNLAVMPVNTGSGLSETFNGIMKAAGVDRGKASRETGKDAKEKGAGRVIFERGFHSCRHTFTSWLRTAGVSEEDRMSLTGHSTRESHAIYSHADAEVLRRAIEKLPAISGPKADA